MNRFPNPEPGDEPKIQSKSKYSKSPRGLNSSNVSDKEKTIPKKPLIQPRISQNLEIEEHIKPKPATEAKVLKSPKRVEEDSVIYGTMETKKEQDMIAQAAYNSGLNSEIDKINESLLKISLIMNVRIISPSDHLEKRRS